ncbi:hypothetical protein [Desulforamulus hydrothermalis]|uniref:Uncharacterized protein n=1 Tax=Desulforamulus hydrothermalis Lam5 = DSM 18033 TaxID=1121428 RepID=K8E7G5_9FIRM|nr:hypothetical protein [Desulforamulus hydrothermalis]CCO07448.1 conserved membrane hypothetical protein [Desulforamulus hydrothermalis Lam5 = DSM 18033]SHH18270.1 hypothetical protein SAMN02745177_01746 [Desulforamulus hydrothermalis Lam5 = DSM 18033]
MPWVITAVVSWIIFYFLVDVNLLRRTVWGGFFTLALGSLVDWGGQYLNLYKFHDVIISWAGCSVFYKFGPVFVIGILFTQYLPKKKYLQVINIVVISLLYLTLELLILQTTAAEYINWHYLASFTVDIGAFIALTWFAETFCLLPYNKGHLF